MLTLLLTLMVLFSPVGDVPADVETITPDVMPTVTSSVTGPYQVVTGPNDAALPPGTIIGVAWDERIDPTTGEIILVPLGGIPYYGEVDEAGVPIGD